MKLRVLYQHGSDAVIELTPVLKQTLSRHTGMSVDELVRQFESGEDVRTFAASYRAIMRRRK